MFILQGEPCTCTTYVQVDNNHWLSWWQIKFQIQTRTHKLISKANHKGTCVYHSRPVVHTSTCKSVSAITTWIYSQKLYKKFGCAHWQSTTLWWFLCIPKFHLSTLKIYTLFFKLIIIVAASRGKSRGFGFTFWEEAICILSMGKTDKHNVT